MMEIIFRGKRRDNGEWVRGYYSEFNPVDIPEKRRRRKSVIFPLEANVNWYNRYFYDPIEVEQETIGQYTGLKDKDGTQIFEGDTIKGLFYHEREVIGIVSFADGSFGVKWMRGEVEMFTPFTSTCNVNWKVIGNIHDE